MSYREFDSVATGIGETISAAPKTITGLGMDFRGLTSGSFHIVWGTLTGTLALEANDDPVGFPNDWVPVSTVTFEALAGIAGKQIAEISGMRSKYYRLVATISSGTGPIKAVAHGKD